MDARLAASVDSKKIDSKDIVLQKQKWRKHFKAANQEVASKELSKTIQRNLKLLLKNIKGPVGVYSNLAGEPCLKALVQELKLDWCFPRVEGDTMAFYRTGWEQLRPGSFGVLEPFDGEPVSVKDMEWCLVPGLGFDRQGIRMGRGKAFYDRTFNGHKTNLVGVSFSPLVTTERLPYEGHDVLMNWIVTDKYLLKVAAKKP